MHAQAATPGNLYDANLALCLRVGELLRLGGEKWVESGTRLYDHAVTSAKADYERLVRPDAGAPSTAATGDIFWVELKRWSVGMQEARSTAFEQQRAFSTGLREAVTTWSAAVNGTLTHGDGVAPFNDAWIAALTKWTQAWPTVARAQ